MLYYCATIILYSVIIDVNALDYYQLLEYGIISLYYKYIIVIL